MGLLTIDAIEAVDCKKMDRMGKSDPYLEIYTLALEKVSPPLPPGPAQALALD